MGCRFDRDRKENRGVEGLKMVVRKGYSGEIRFKGFFFLNLGLINLIEDGLVNWFIVVE